MKFLRRLLQNIRLDPIPLEGTHLKALASPDELHEALTESANEPVLIYKHSTACPVSARARMRLEQYLEENEGDVPECYVVDVIADRPVSNAVESELGVRHESPQLILVRDRKAVWDTSHSAIKGENIEQALAELEAAG